MKTPTLGWLSSVLIWWGALGAVDASGLMRSWPHSGWALAACAVWGFNLLLVVYGIGPPFRVSRPPILVAGFSLFLTLLGSGSYWATVQLYPLYRVGIEYAAWFLALCTAVALGAAAVVRRLSHQTDQGRHGLVWDWARVGALSYLLFALATIGTIVAIARIGYIPILAGDPTSARVDFPIIGGVWYRLSLLGGLVAVLVAVQAAARRATLGQYAIGLASLGLVGLYGPRFFVALPVGVALLLWDRLRSPLPFRRAVLLFLIIAPVLGVVGYFRERDQNVAFLGPVAVLLYGTLGEFRDLGWALDYYGFGDRFLHGATLGSAVVPLLPTPVWQILGIDKAAVYSQSSANFLADAMGQSTGQRIGVYGELFMNFGWTGALVGAVLYGALVGYLDERFHRIGAGDVRGLILAIAVATIVFALVGQLNMFTSTLTGFGYPLALVVLIAARQAKSRIVA